MRVELKNYISDDFSLFVSHVDNEPDYPMHCHDCQELVIVTSGSGIHFLGGREYEIGPGDVFVVGGEAEHAYQSTDHLAHFNILFDLGQLKLPVFDLKTMPGFISLFQLEPKLRTLRNYKSRLHLSLKELGKAKTLAWQLEHELKERSPGYKAMCCSIFLELVALLSRIYGMADHAKHVELWGIGQAIKLLETRYNERISIESLARVSKMSRRNFQRLFTELTGEPPKNYLVRIRLERAAELLLSRPSAAIGEIALATGFYDGNYFCRQFSGHFKISPKTYRKLNLSWNE